MTDNVTPKDRQTAEMCLLYDEDRNFLQELSVREVMAALAAERRKVLQEFEERLANGPFLTFKCKCGEMVNTSPIPMYEAMLKDQRRKLLDSPEVRGLVEKAAEFRDNVLHERGALAEMTEGNSDFINAVLSEFDDTVGNALAAFEEFSTRQGGSNDFSA